MTHIVTCDLFMSLCIHLDMYNFTPSIMVGSIITYTHFSTRHSCRCGNSYDYLKLLLFKCFTDDGGLCVLSKMYSLSVLANYIIITYTTYWL